MRKALCLLSTNGVALTSPSLAQPASVLEDELSFEAVIRFLKNQKDIGKRVRAARERDRREG